jgi:hypothetical protein
MRVTKRNDKMSLLFFMDVIFCQFRQNI